MSIITAREVMPLNEPRITVHRGRVLIEGTFDINGVIELQNNISALKMLVKSKFEPWP
jgi:hypothetical protein